MKMTKEVELKESIDYGETNINAIINNDRNFNSNKEKIMILKKLVIQHRNSLDEELQAVGASEDVSSDDNE